MRRARVALAFAFPALLLLFLFTSGCGSSYSGNSSSSTCNGGGGGGCAKPTITSLMPPSVVIPSASGTTTLTITGTQFALGDNLQVGFCSAQLCSNSIRLTINTLLSTSTSLVVTIPNSALQSAGTYSVSMQDVTSGNAAYPPLTFTVTPSAMVVSTIAPPDGRVGTVYPTQTINVSGGTAPYTATATGLPAGLSFATNTGGSVLTISGTPTTVQSAVMFTITVTDSSPTNQTVPANYTINIAPPLLSLSPGALPPGTVGAAYSQTLSVAGGTAPYMATPTGLPAGLSLTANSNGSVLTISGIPTTAQTGVTFSVTVSDMSTPQQTAMVTYTINVAAAPSTCYLNGQYAFQFGGGGETYVGSITIASNGFVTGGVVDYKDTFATLRSELNDPILPGTSATCVNDPTVANTGTVSFTVTTGLQTNTDFQRVLHFALRTDDTVGFAKLTIPGNSMYLAIGRIQHQDHPTVNFFGTYAFGLFGSDPAHMNTTRYGIVGALCTSAARHLTYLHADLDDSYTVSTDVVLSDPLISVSFSGPDPNGRIVMSPWNFSNANGATLNLILYVVNGNKAFVMEATPPTTIPRTQQTLIGTITGLGGQVCRPSGSFFDKSKLSNSVLDLGGVELVTSSPAFSSKIGVINNVNSGLGTASLTEDINRGGTSSTISDALVNYSISPGGRGVITYMNGPSQEQVIAYFDGAGAAYLMQESNAMGTTNVTEVGTLQPQAAGPFSVTSISSGTYALMAPFEDQAPLSIPTIEEVTIDNAARSFSAAGPGPSSSSASTTPYSVDSATGRGTVTMDNGTLIGNGSRLNFYIVSPTKLVLAAPNSIPEVLESLEQ